jgi:hypothetical protein
VNEEVLAARRSQVQRFRPDDLHMACPDGKPAGAAVIFDVRLSRSVAGAP